MDSCMILVGTGCADQFVDFKYFTKLAKKIAHKARHTGIHLSCGADAENILEENGVQIGKIIGVF